MCITFSVFFLFFLKSMQPELNAILTLGGAGYANAYYPKHGLNTISQDLRSGIL